MAKTFTPQPNAAAALQGLSSMATKEVLAQLAQRCTAEGVAIEFESGGGVIMADRVRAGDAADLVVLGADAMRTLADEGHVIADSVRPLFRSDMVFAIPDSAEVPDVSSPRAIRELISGDLRIGYSTGPSGTALLRQLEAWGLRPEIDGRLVQARPGVPVGRLLTDGEADVGLQQNSELAGMPGVRVLGPLPGECAVTTVFSGGVLAASGRPDAASGALSRMADPAYSAIVKGCGMTPAGG